MGTAAGKKITENQVPVEKAVYAVISGPNATQKEVKNIIQNHCQWSLFDERHPHMNRSGFDNFWSFSKICRITLENTERNGHPETNAPPRDVKPRNMTPTLRRAAMMKPIVF